MEPAAFWSYVRDDDDHERGRIARLRTDLAAEIRMQTGAQFRIFFDRTDILWGQQWRERIDSGINAVTVLIPVVTPSFFRSDNCRDEVARFLRREAQLGRDDLILPIYYVTAREMSSKGDAIGEVFQDRQHHDWRALRHEDPDSAQYRKSLARLAERLTARLGDIDATPDQRAVPEPSDDEDEPGFIELLATAEEAMPELPRTLTAIGAAITEVGDVAREATAMMNRSNNNRRGAAAGKLNAARYVVERLDDPVERIESLTAEYLDQLDRIDGGMRALTSRARDSEENRAASAELLDSLRTLESQATEGLTSALTFADSLGDLRDLSSTMRKPLRRIEASSRRIADTMPIYERWRSELEGELAKSDTH